MPRKHWDYPDLRQLKIRCLKGCGGSNPPRGTQKSPGNEDFSAFSARAFRLDGKTVAGFAAFEQQLSYSLSGAPETVVKRAQTPLAPLPIRCRDRVLGRWLLLRRESASVRGKRGRSAYGCPVADNP